MTDNGQPPPETLTVKEAAALLGYRSTAYVITLIQTGALLAERDSKGQWRVSDEAVRNFKRPPHRSKVSHHINRAFADGAHPKNTPVNPARKWETVQEQIDAVRAGRVKPIYLRSNGEVVEP